MHTARTPSLGRGGAVRQATTAARAHHILHPHTATTLTLPHPAKEQQAAGPGGCPASDGRQQRTGTCCRLHAAPPDRGV